MPAARFAIAQVTPFPWESGHEVNEQIARTAELLAARGHGVTIVAPSVSEELVRRSRARIRSGDGAAAFGAFEVLAVGEVIPAPTSASSRTLVVVTGEQPA